MLSKISVEEKRERKREEEGEEEREKKEENGVVQLRRRFPL